MREIFLGWIGNKKHWTEQKKKDQSQLLSLYLLPRLNNAWRYKSKQIIAVLHIIGASFVYLLFVINTYLHSKFTGINSYRKSHPR